MSVSDDQLNKKTSSVGIYPSYVVSVLMLAQTFSFIDRMIVGLLVGPIRATFDISDTQYSLLAGFAFSLFYAIMGLPLARIADSKSRRTLIACGIALWSLMTAMCGLAKGYWGFFLARMGVGVGEATLSPAAFSMMADYFPKRTLAIALSVFTLGVTFGSGLAYMIGGQVVSYAESLGSITLPLLGTLHGWQITFLLVGLPGLLVAALMFTVKEPERKGKMAGDTGTKAIPISEVLAFLKQRRRAVSTHVIGVSIFIMVVFGVNVWGPSYLIRTFGFDRGEAGFTFGLIMMLCGTVGLLLGGYLAGKWYERGRKDAYSRVILLSAACMLPAMIALGYASTPFWGILCLSIATFFSAFQGGIAGGVLQLMTPNQMRSQVAALYFLVANLIGLGLGPTVVAAITDYVFADDAAIAQSLALNAAILCPLAIAIIWSGLKQVETAIEAAEVWDE
ncbi:MAG: MFS transporter [Pseudomonadales bacterium]